LRARNENDFELISAYDWDIENKVGFKEPEKNIFRIMAVARPLE